MKNQPRINVLDLARVVNVLAVIAPGHASETFIRRQIGQEWPFNNLTVGDWVAYAEDPVHTNHVRVALAPRSVDRLLRHLREQAKKAGPGRPFVQEPVPEGGPVSPHRTHDNLVRQFLDLSTSHVRPSTEQALKRMDRGTVLSGSYGFMIHIAIKDMDFVETLPVEMRIIVHVARVKYPGVAYALFDRDGPVNPDFPVYDHEWN